MDKIENMKKTYDETIDFKLFAIDRFKEGEEYEKELEKIDGLTKIAKSLIKEFGDQIVFDSWFKYLKENIKSQKDAWNFMGSFCDYDGQCLKIQNPYAFLGVLLKKLELSLDADPVGDEENNMFDTFDSIYINLLVKSGIVKEEDYFYMNPYFDEKLRKAYNNA